MGERYNRVHPRFWRDTEAWSEDARTLALYLLTGPHRQMAGIYWLKRQYACADLGWDEQRLRKPFEELLANGFIAYDEAASVVLIRKALKSQAPENPNQVTAVIRALEELPQTALLSEFETLAERYSERLTKGLREAFPEGLGQPEAVAVAESEAESEADEPSGDGSDGAGAPSPSPSPPSPRKQHKVNRKVVTDEEYGLASEVIAAFNEIAGSGFTVDANLTPVVGRIRERKELTAEQHRRLIELNFKKPWWDGPPSPAVIYGNPKQFESSIEVARAATERRESTSKYDAKTEVAKV